jgi:predicted DCC family thiol-disulfide oxidoreductase YuxK
MNVIRPPSKPLLIYDGDCRFCRRQVSRCRRVAADAVEYLPAQTDELRERFPELPLDTLLSAVHFITPAGTIHTGADAIYQLFAVAPRWKCPVWLYRHLPGFAEISEAVYRFVAGHRVPISAVTRGLAGPHTDVPSYELTRSLFLRGLGIIHLIAFVSLGTQINGLIGPDGILPATELMANARNWADANSWAGAIGNMPTLCWLIGAGKVALHAQWIAGALLSVLLILHIAPLLHLAGLWVLYLSLSVVGREFLGYQWDALLLETTWLAMFVAPWPGRNTRVTTFGLWTMRWLVFRLMFSAGMVKLASGDPAWRDLTALNYHYWTQPLPTWTAWYAHQLPDWFQRFSCGTMFVIELIIPFLIFTPRRLRMAGAVALIFLQVLIIATGNYCFFNWLTILITLWLLDDHAWHWLARHRTPTEVLPARAPVVWRAVAGAVLVVVFFVTFINLCATCRVPVRWVKPVATIHETVNGALAPLRSVNNYGLFAVMTKTRPEIVIEGSDDGQTWRAYEFKYKPGDVNRRPAFVAPHQPRLDWQMWFASLGNYRGNPWLIQFCARLLTGSADCLSLIRYNPFPHRPPRYVRAVVYGYSFTNPAERDATGAWWKREPRGLYCPVLSLRSPEQNQ